MEIPKEVLDLAPWSTSMANLAIACPWAFDTKYRKKQKSVEPAPEQQTVGNVVHKILEIAVQGPTLSHVFKQVLPTFDLTHNTKEMVLTYRDVIEDFLRRLESFKVQMKVTKVFPERKMAITPEFTECKFFDKKGLFRGVIDLTLLLADKRAVVIDHKSGAPKEIRHHQYQLESYAVILTAQMPELTAVRAGLNSLGGDPLPNGKRIVWAREHSAQHINTNLRSSLIKFLTKAATSAQSDEPRKGWMCNWCGYKPICPRYQ
jgi:CRISPR/Cas system-associated exonuclease Cas4 (RecB family)